MSTLSAATWVPVSALLPKTLPAIDVRATTASGYVFFDAMEAQFVESACERLIPADPSGPGAHGAPVAHYIDYHLSSAWGTGERLFRSGAWQPGTTLNVPPPFTPATLFHRALRAINLAFEKRGTAFAALSWEAQGKFLTRLESGGIDLDGAPPAVFFDMLLRMTVEGFFSDPTHAATVDRVRWRICGFPGAHAAWIASHQL